MGLGGAQIGGYNPAHGFVDTFKGVQGGGAFWTTTQTVSPSTSILASTASAGS